MMSSSPPGVCDTHQQQQQQRSCRDLLLLRRLVPWQLMAVSRSEQVRVRPADVSQYLPSFLHLWPCWAPWVSIVSSQPAAWELLRC